MGKFYTKAEIVQLVVVFIFLLLMLKNGGII